MSRYQKALLLRRRLHAWFDQPLGRSLQAVEANRLRMVLPQFFGATALQLGAVGRLDLFDACTAPTRILLDLPLQDRDCTVHAFPETLPLDSRSIDIALLPHTLDFADYPHQVLREVERVLTPEGHVVILGFNPLSLWGLWRLFLRRRREPRVPWCGRFIGLRRIKDWLELLHFGVTHGNMLYYRPPVQNQTALDRFSILDKIGERWLPMMAGAYLLVAKKRVAGMTPIRPSWKTKVLKNTGVVEPAARIIVLDNFRRRRSWRE